MSQLDKMPPVPLTLEGSAVLHQMLRVRWPQWRAQTASDRADMLSEAATCLEELEKDQSAAFQMLGHKGDLMLVHFRKNFDQLLDAQQHISRLRLFDFMDQAHSYVSVVELGLYESTLKTYSALAEKGVEPHTPEWDKEIGDTMERQREAMRPRLYPEMPPAKFLCFYPMDRLRGEHRNWYQLPLAERQRQMAEHGMVGRRYAGTVRQIITGSIGYDDWEWGVDLFADDPLVFKHLIYEMRFDEVSAVYAKFGQFFISRRTDGDGLKSLLAV